MSETIKVLSYNTSWESSEPKSNWNQEVNFYEPERTEVAAAIADEIYDEVANDAYWHRKTSKKVNKFKIEDKLNLFNYNKKKCEPSFNKNKSIDNKFEASLQILGIKKFGSINQLKKQYKKMLKKFHPDLNKCGSSEKIIELNEAYSSIINFLIK